MRLPEIPLQIPLGILKKYEIRIFGVFFGIFGVFFSIPAAGGICMSGWYFWPILGVCGVFCSVAGSWVVNPNLRRFEPPYPVLQENSVWALLIQQIAKTLSKGNFGPHPPKSTIRTRSTTTSDRNLQFRGAVSTGGSPLDFLLFLQYLSEI